MHIKALTAAITTAVLSAALIQTAHAKALSPSTTTNTNSNAGSTVTVSPGDTLSSIATENETTYVRLFDANTQITNPDLIFPGEVIQIPDVNAQLPDRLGVATPAPATTDSAVEPSTVQAPAPAPAAQQTTSPTADGVWAELANCESGGNWSADTGNGFYGGLQFTASSWQAVGGSGLPSQASESEQISRAETLLARQGWSAWPACSAKLGL